MPGEASLKLVPFVFKCQDDNTLDIYHCDTLCCATAICTPLTLGVMLDREGETGYGKAGNHQKYRYVSKVMEASA